MKVSQSSSFTGILLISLVSKILCASNRAIIARDSSLSPSIAEKFHEIDQTIQKLEEGERKPKQGNPDFSRATGELIQLSIQAEEAKELLNLMMQSKLDQQSSAKIDQSLKSSADGVGVITELDKQGKEYFQKNNITGIIVQILQVELYEFRDLFNALNKHALPQYADSYKRSETKFICDIVSALQVLDPSKVSPSDVQRCASGNYFSDPGNDGQATQPPGWSGCSKSAATFFTNAYAHNTIGTSNTMCGPKVPTSQFVSPFNVFPNL